MVIFKPSNLRYFILCCSEMYELCLRNEITSPFLLWRTDLLMFCFVFVTS